MKKLIASALLLAPLATPALAQGGPLDHVPAVEAVKAQLRPLCRAQGRRANFVADFLFSVDADGRGGDNDIYLTGSGFECLPRDPNSQAEPTHPAEGRQWLIVHQPRGGYRLVWSGRTPSLFANGESGLMGPGYNCHTDMPCRRYIWNGRAVVPQGRRR